MNMSQRLPPERYFMPNACAYLSSAFTQHNNLINHTVLLVMDLWPRTVAAFIGNGVTMHFRIEKRHEIGAKAL